MMDYKLQMFVYKDGLKTTSVFCFRDFVCNIEGKDIQEDDEL